MFENEEKARKELEAKGKLFLEKSPKLTNQKFGRIQLLQDFYRTFKANYKISYN